MEGRQDPLAQAQLLPTAACPAHVEGLPRHSVAPMLNHRHASHLPPHLSKGCWTNQSAAWLPLHSTCVPPWTPHGMDTTANWQSQKTKEHASQMRCRNTPRMQTARGLDTQCTNEKTAGAWAKSKQATRRRRTSGHGNIPQPLPPPPSPPNWLTTNCHPKASTLEGSDAL